MCFVGFNSLPNFIVILFNLLYHVFIVGFNCKGCVIERESVKTQAIEDRKVFAGNLRLSIPQNDACLVHDWNVKNQDKWRQLCFASSSQVRPSREILAKHFVLPDYAI